jgi:hypothetical protein
MIEPLPSSAMFTVPRRVRNDQIREPRISEGMTHRI